MKPLDIRFYEEPEYKFSWMHRGLEIYVPEPLILLAPWDIEPTPLEKLHARIEADAHRAQVDLDHKIYMRLAELQAKSMYRQYEKGRRNYFLPLEFFQQYDTGRFNKTHLRANASGPE